MSTSFTSGELAIAASMPPGRCRLTDVVALPLEVRSGASRPSTWSSGRDAQRGARGFCAARGA
jgi:hypothetical protein